MSFGSTNVGAGIQNCETDLYEAETNQSTLIDIVLTFENNGEPVVGEEYCVVAPDGAMIFGFLDSKGGANVTGLACEEGESCDITFPRMDQAAWDDG